MSNYRIQHREMSPDVIEKRIIGTKTWVVYIAPIGNRNNNEAHRIIKFLEKDDEKFAQ